MIKKGVFILLVLMLFLFPIISAVETDMKSEFNSGETLLAKISGNFLEPILKENIYFYRGHVRIAMDYDVTKINDEYYIYASLMDKTSGNYSLVIKDVEYMKASTSIDEDIPINFTISNSTADFSVLPGFIKTENNFYLEVQNLQDYKLILAAITDLNTNDSIELKSGEIKKINFEKNNLEEDLFTTIELQSGNTVYSIPVYLYANETSETSSNPGEIEFDPKFSEIEMSTNSETNEIIYLKNTGNTNLENIVFTVDDSIAPYVFLSDLKINKLEKNESFKLEIYLISPDSEKDVIGQIIAEDSSGTQTFYELSLKFVQDFIPINESSSSVIPISRTCSELDGFICNSNQTCEGESVNAKDAYCCLGNCQEKSTSSSSGKMIGWFLLIILIIGLVWFYQKYIKR